MPGPAGRPVGQGTVCGRCVRVYGRCTRLLHPPVAACIRLPPVFPSVLQLVFPPVLASRPCFPSLLPVLVACFCCLSLPPVRSSPPCCPSLLPLLVACFCCCPCRLYSARASPGCCRSSRMTDGMQNAANPMTKMMLPAMTNVVVSPTFSARNPVPSSPIAEGSSPKL